MEVIYIYLYCRIVLGYGLELPLNLLWDINNTVYANTGLDTWTGQTVIPSLLSYEPPEIYNGTLRRWDEATTRWSEDGSFAFVNLASDAASTWLTFEGNFGYFPDQVTISYRLDATANESYACITSSDLTGYTGAIHSTYIICRTDTVELIGLYHFEVRLHD